MPQERCYHNVELIEKEEDKKSESGKPYRWVCVKCGKKLKVLSGCIITAETARKLLNDIK